MGKLKISLALFIYSFLPSFACQSSEEEKCRNGSPALIKCEAATKTQSTQIEFVCEAQPSFACEQIEDAYFCCAPLIETPFPSNAMSTVAISRSLKVETTTTTLPLPRGITQTEPPTTTTTAKVMTTKSQTTQTTVGGSSCVDKNEQCEYVKSLCSEEKYEKMLSDECAKTCGFCGGKTHKKKPKKCEDRGKDCKRAKFLCRHKVYSALMAQECAKTCKKCTIEGSKEKKGKNKRPERKESDENADNKNNNSNEHSSQSRERSHKSSENCVDNYRRCGTWKTSGFCTTNAYPHTVKHRFCAKTCDLCE